MATAYTENFNGLGNNSVTSLPSGWKFGSGAAPTYANVTNYTSTTEAAGTTGGAVLTQTSTGGTYNFANGANASSTDRAIGFLASAGYSGQRHIMLQLINTSCNTISQLDVSFAFEKYRNGTNIYDWNFYGSTNGSTWTALTLGDQNYPADGDNITVYNPPTSTTKSVSITGLSIAGAASYYLRWTYKDASATYTNAMALGFDDFSVTATGAACSGASAPTVQASALTISSVTATTMNLNWTRGNGSRCLVIARASAAVATNPSAGVSYTDNSVFGSGSAIGSGFVVYAGFGTSVSISGLNPSTTYHFKVYEFNGNCTCTSYITGGSAPINNATTCVAAPTVQSSSLTFSNITTNQLQLNWIRGNGANCIIVAKAGSAVTTAPVFGTTYTANANFGSGSTTAAGEYVIYAGNGTSVITTGLNFNTNYYFSIFEYNGSGTCTHYAVVAPLTGNASTDCTEPTSQVTFASYSASSASITLNLTNGNGTNRIVIGSLTPITAAEVPIDGSNYIANANFGTGSAIGAGFVVYTGSGSTSTITGLTPSTLYYFAAFDFCIASNNYLTSTYPTLTVSTTPGCGAPSSPASGITFTSISDISMTIGWTNGNGTNRLVVLSTLPINASDVPVNSTSYTANTLFGAGSILGNSFVVYASTGNSVTVTGLTANTNYYAAVFEFNNCPASNYLTSIYPSDFDKTICSASPIAFQGFEASGMTWAGTFTTSATTGASDNPANQRILSGSRSYQNAGSAGTITLNNFATTGFVNKKITIRVSATGVTAGQGMDAADNIKFFVALNGAAFAGTADVRITGGANAAWPYSASLTATTFAGTALNVVAPQGGVSTNNYSTVEIYIPDATTQVALKIVATSDSPNEMWNIDDITLSGCVGSSSVTPTQLSFTNMPTGCFVPNQTLSLAVSATDGNGAIDNTYTGTITLSVNSGPGNLTGTIAVAAVAGVANFNAFALDLDGSYTLTASDGTLTGTSGSIIISVACASVCSKIKSLYVDACLSASEGREEFFTFINGSDPMPLSQLKVKFPNGATYCNSGCATQTWTTNPAKVAALNATAGCPGLFVEANPIPAYVQVIVFTGSSPTYPYNFAAECGTGPIYAVFANNTSPVGRFANYNSNCTSRTLEATFGTCTDQVTYQRCLLSPSDGAFVDFAFGIALYNNDGCTPLTALPVQLVKFDAKYHSNLVNISWTTVAEINNDYFSVMRSSDGKHFEEIKRVKGAGNSSVSISYDAIDEAPMNGVNYYQLKQTDYDGKQSLSEIVAVSAIGKSIAFESVIQNTSEGSITVNLQSSDNQVLTLSLYDIAGREVLKQEAQATSTSTKFWIPVSQFAKGIYMLKAGSQGEAIVRKVRL